MDKRVKEEWLKKIDKTISQGPYSADSWDNFEQYQTPKWYKDGKLGIFIHWGVYSVPAFGNEWYPRRMYRSDDEVHEHHIKKYGPVDKFGYKDFIPMFKAENFDPTEWAELFKEAGAAYYYNSCREWGFEGAINYKNEAMPANAAVYDVERGQLDKIRYPFWQTDTSLALDSWCYTEGMTYRTTKSGILYAIFMGWPEDGKLTIKNFYKDRRFCPIDIEKLEMLGVDGELNFSRDSEGMHVQLPKGKRPCEFAWTLRLSSK
jgi:Alpha-L-fucosidase/Alpha-L-fucosidase C-terminal domain